VIGRVAQGAALQVGDEVEVSVRSEKPITARRKIAEDGTISLPGLDKPVPAEGAPAQNLAIKVAAAYGLPTQAESPVSVIVTARNPKRLYLNMASGTVASGKAIPVNRGYSVGRDSPVPIFRLYSLRLDLEGDKFTTTYELSLGPSDTRFVLLLELFDDAGRLLLADESEYSLPGQVGPTPDLPKVSGTSSGVTGKGLGKKLSKATKYALWLLPAKKAPATQSAPAKGSGQATDANTVSVLGSVPRPGTYPLSAVGTVRKLLLSCGYKQVGKWDRLYIIHPADRQNVEWVVDPQKVLDGSANDIPLAAGEILLVEDVRKTMNRDAAPATRPATLSWGKGPVRIQDGNSVIEGKRITIEDGHMQVEGNAILQANNGADVKADRINIRPNAPATQPATRPAASGATTQPAGSKLEFRIAPTASSLTNEERDSYMDWLKAGKVGFWWKGGRIRGRMPDHAWLSFAGDMANADNLVTGEYKGQKYVLVSDKPGQTMVPGEGKEAWGLTQVYATTDGMNHPTVGFELDNSASSNAADTAILLRPAPEMNCERNLHDITDYISWVYRRQCHS
jgi:protein involved in polysaccharide export with SLBB domain